MLSTTKKAHPAHGDFAPAIFVPVSCLPSALLSICAPWQAWHAILPLSSSPNIITPQPIPSFWDSTLLLTGKWLHHSSAAAVPQWCTHHSIICIAAFVYFIYIFFFFSGYAYFNIFLPHLFLCICISKQVFLVGCTFISLFRHSFGALWLESISKPMPSQFSVLVNFWLDLKLTATEAYVQNTLHHVDV